MKLKKNEDQSMDSDIERELINVHILRPYDELPDSYSREEIDEVRFWTKEEILQSLGKGILTPNFELEYTKILSTL